MKFLFKTFMYVRAFKFSFSVISDDLFHSKEKKEFLKTLSFAVIRYIVSYCHICIQHYYHNNDDENKSLTTEH